MKMLYLIFRKKACKVAIGTLLQPPLYSFPEKNKIGVEYNGITIEGWYLQSILIWSFEESQYSITQR
jgi:hypothetical protein